MLRVERGMSQRQLARLLRMTRQAISHWECGVQAVPARHLHDLSHAFGLDPDDLRRDLAAQGARPRRRPVLTGRRRRRLPYPIRGTVERMCALGEQEAGLQRAVQSALPPADYERVVEHFPRDTPHELLAVHQMLIGGCRSSVMAPIDARCPFFIRDDYDFTYAGDRLQPALVWRQGDERMIVFGQVDIYVTLQERGYRVDFLVYYQRRGKRGVWLYVEIDGGYHEETANQDARRAAGLMMPEIRYENHVVRRSGFFFRLLADVRKVVAGSVRRRKKQWREARQRYRELHAKAAHLRDVA